MLLGNNFALKLLPINIIEPSLPTFSPHSILNTWEEKCELQVAAKHHVSTFGLGSDKVIGLAVVPLATVVKEANVTLGLSYSLPYTDQGQALLNVLSVRYNDEHAKEFVSLKRQKRDSRSVEVV